MAKRRQKTEVQQLDEVLGQFLAPEYRYSFWQNPDVVRTKEDAIHDGINCVSLAHLAIKELFGYELPPHLGCAEMYLDRTHFTGVKDTAASRQGDLFWFGITDAPRRPEDIEPAYNSHGELLNWCDFPVKHVAINTGTGEHRYPLLLHATPADGGGNVVWPLPEFAQHRRYQKLYGITRLAARGP